jgi:hypothetical protein|tara:strand:- start:3638 stop:3850 length:213 start_codon:yes stop_codon:yes gene_type:complete
MSLKFLVNDKKLWDSLNEELDRRLNFIHIQMEQTLKSEDLYRLQGEARALRKIKQLRDQINDRADANFSP